jgi:hypothetical protein
MMLPEETIDEAREIRALLPNDDKEAIGCSVFELSVGYSECEREQSTRLHQYHGIWRNKDLDGMEQGFAVQRGTGSFEDTDI